MAKKIAGIEEDVIITAVVLGAVGIGGYYLGKSMGWWGNTATAASTTAATAAAADLAAATSQDPPNYQATQYSSWADSIYSAGGVFSFTTDFDTINNIMDQIWNLADLYSLIQAFGVRQACAWSWVINTGCANYDLPSFLTKTLSASQIATLNQTLSYNTVQYTF